MPGDLGEKKLSVPDSACACTWADSAVESREPGRICGLSLFSSVKASANLSYFTLQILNSPRAKNPFDMEAELAGANVTSRRLNGTRSVEAGTPVKHFCIDLPSKVGSLMTAAGL